MNHCLCKPVVWNELDKLLDALNFPKGVDSSSNIMIRLATIAILDEIEIKEKVEQFDSSFVTVVMDANDEVSIEN